MQTSLGARINHGLFPVGTFSLTHGQWETTSTTFSYDTLYVTLSEKRVRCVTQKSSFNPRSICSVGFYVNTSIFDI